MALYIDGPGSDTDAFLNKCIKQKAVTLRCIPFLIIIFAVFVTGLLQLLTHDWMNHVYIRFVGQSLMLSGNSLKSDDQGIDSLPVFASPRVSSSVLSGTWQLKLWHCQTIGANLQPDTSIKTSGYRLWLWNWALASVFFQGFGPGDGVGSAVGRMKLHSQSVKNYFFKILVRPLSPGTKMIAAVSPHGECLNETLALANTKKIVNRQKYYSIRMDAVVWNCIL